MLGCAIAAFRVELEYNQREEDLPMGICRYIDDDGKYRGDRYCNNAIAASVVSILVAITLMMIDLQVPCLSYNYSVSNLPVSCLCFLQWSWIFKTKYIIYHSCTSYNGVVCNSSFCNKAFLFVCLNEKWCYECLYYIDKTPLFYVK